MARVLPAGERRARAFTQAAEADYHDGGSGKLGHERRRRNNLFFSVTRITLGVKGKEGHFVAQKGQDGQARPG